MKKVLDALPANVFGEGRAVPVEREERIADAGMREGALVEKDGGLFTVSDGALVKPEWADKPKKVRQAASYVGVKKSVFDLINKTETLFENPETGLIEPDDIYLSGNVRKKLEMAEAGREDNPAYGKNVEALRKVQPERIGIDAIHARIGSSWVPAKVYEAFVKHLGFSSVSVEKARLEGEDAIRELPGKCRRVFELHLEGKKNDEIAKILGISVLTVKSHKQNAIHFLKERVGNLFLLFVYMNEL